MVRLPPGSLATERGLTQVLQETRGTNTLSYVPGVLQHDPAQVGNAQWAYFHADAQTPS
jgi:hypothetical protein